MLLIRFGHYLGMAMWIGGWLAMALVATSACGEDAQSRAGFVASISRLHTLLIAPGAVLTIGSGIMWSMAIVGAGGYESRVAPVGLSVMTAVGILGGVLVLAVSLPAAIKLRALSRMGAEGQMHPAFEQLRKRLAVVSNIVGVCALVSLFASVLAP